MSGGHITNILVLLETTPTKAAYKRKTTFQRYNLTTFQQIKNAFITIPT